METLFKDVAHLYLGCEMYVFPPDTVGEWLNEKLIKIPDLKYTTTLTADRISEVQSQLGHIPILRPLSDCSEDENNYIYTEFDEDIYESKAEMCADVTRWFLSKRFDLFGFIESGQAIDATKLPVNPYLKPQP